MNKKQLLLVVLCGILLGSCTLYKSTSINSPILDKKGDAQLKGSSLSSLEVSGVYALSDRLAISLDAGSANSYFLRYEVEENEYDNIWLLNYKFDAGLGLYNQAKNKRGIQVFTGYSIGRSATIQNSIFQQESGILKTSFKGPYLQISYRYALKENTFLNFLCKGKYYEFYKFENIVEYRLGSMKEGDSFYIQQVGIEWKEVKENVTINFQILYSDYYGAASGFTVRGVSTHFGFAYRFK